ncbi:unnamed protein product [Ambrosiozyma monospora]|uniref:Unnamed protein product n=1 Tax=Ambrosiozyma monospora TaxID=43982 RepID=A0A9W7DFZ7_AMBMO|nr:unnamed protein product [Ambrosiozyma monospora]
MTTSKKHQSSNLLEYQLDELFEGSSTTPAVGNSSSFAARSITPMDSKLKTAEIDVFEPITENVSDMSAENNTNGTDNSTDSNYSRNLNDDNVTEDGEEKLGFFKSCLRQLIRYSKYVGPGIMVSVSYMDPGNYSTNVAAGSDSKFTLLCVVLLSNLIAIFMQSLSVKLGTVTGMDYARCCKEFLPSWLNIIIYLIAEVAIIATDLAEVIGSAIALNILLKIPLAAGTVLTIADVLLVMFFYRPTGSIRMVKVFEVMVAMLVFSVMICFCVQLSYIPASVSVREVFRGYAPSKKLFQGNTMYDAIGILGATVMPHSIILGSGLVQSRLREYDIKKGYVRLNEDEETNPAEREEIIMKWRPSYQSIKYSYKYSLIELAVSLFTFALFINSAILIVADYR